MISVKVLLRSVTDANGELVDFDTKKISVKVSSPVVRLERLSKDELTKLMYSAVSDRPSSIRSESNDSSNHIEIGQTDERPNLNLKRKSDIPTARMTRAKRKKLDSEMPENNVNKESVEVPLLPDLCTFSKKNRNFK